MNEVSQPPSTNPLDPVKIGVRDLEAYLALWAARDETPAARPGASEAVAAIDLVLRELHELRSRLVTEIRSYDDESAARTDALLARAGAEKAEWLDAGSGAGWSPVDSRTRTCPGCGAKVVGHDRCGDPEAPGVPGGPAVIGDAIRVSMPLVELVVIAGAAFMLGCVVGWWLS